MKTHTFNGRKYLIYDERIDGLCTVDGPADPYSITISPDLSPLRTLDVEIHEAIHAIEHDAPEETVERLGKELARWLWRRGYRKVES